MIDIERATKAVLKLSALKYFPGEPQARLAIVEQMGEMCETDEHVDWLIKRTLKLFAEWPGIGELRAVYCSKFRPKDGVETYSAVYVDGIPSEKPEPTYKLTGGGVAALPGEVLSAARSLDVHVRQLAEMKRMSNSKPLRPVDLPVVKLTTENRITQADIDRAEKELRDKKAAAEVLNA